MRNRFRVIFAIFVALASLRFLYAETPATQTAPAAPQSLAPGSRIIKAFPFEETNQGNYENTPMYWSKVVGRGFPAYAAGQFDSHVFRPHTTSPTEKGNSFRMDIDGGSAAYQYIVPPGAEDARINVSTSADYFVLGFVKTKNLRYSRAEITAWFADEKGNLILSTETHSDAFADDPDAAGAMDNTSWHVLHLYMPGPPPNGKSLVLQLGLLQPQQLSAHPLGKFELYHQDIKGSAYFDDVTVFQLPRVSVAVPQAVSGSIFSTDDPIALDLTVADLADIPTTSKPAVKNTLNAHLTITDPDGLIFATQKWSITPKPDQLWTQNYTHPPLPPGFYTATLDVADGTTVIARRRTDFLSMPTSPPRNANTGTGEKPANEFGLVATNLPVDAWNELPPILRHTGAGLLEIPAWRKDMSEESLFRQDKSLDALLASLQRLDVHTIASFSQVPAVLSAKLTDSPSAGGGDSLLALADADPTIWRPYLSFLLARYSNRVDLWQIGSDASPFPGLTLSESQAATATTSVPAEKYPKLFASAYAELSQLLSHPRLVIPWNALYDFNPSEYPHAVLDLQLPSGIKPSQIPTYIASFREATTESATLQPTAPNILAHIEPLEDRQYSRDDRLADFAQRVIYARTANPRATLIDLPIARRTTLGSFTAHTQPEEILLIYRTIIRELGNHQYKRELPLSPGLKAFLFQHEENGTIALWNESAPTESVSLDLPLGAAPRLIDLSGNVTMLTPDPATNLTHLTVTTTPIFIDHVDADVLSLRSSFALSSSNFPAGIGAMQTDVLLANPYTIAISGNLHLLPPPGWTVDPAGFSIYIGPGATFRQRVTFHYPYSESVGPKTVNALLKLDTTFLPAATRRLELTFPIAVASDVVEMECFCQSLPNGDLSVNQMITNITDRPLNAQAYVLVPGFARQQRFVVDLQPNQTVIKRFLFPLSGYVDATSATTPADIAAALTGKSATAGLRQADGRTLISKTLPLN